MLYFLATFLYGSVSANSRYPDQSVHPHSLVRICCSSTQYMNLVVDIVLHINLHYNTVLDTDLVQRWVLKMYRLYRKMAINGQFVYPAT